MTAGLPAVRLLHLERADALISRTARDEYGNLMSSCSDSTGPSGLLRTQWHWSVMLERWA
jgi:hypothetical protein